MSAKLGLRPVYDSTWLSRVLARIALTPAFAGAGWPGSDAAPGGVALHKGDLSSRPATMPWKSSAFIAATPSSTVSSVP